MPTGILFSFPKDMRRKYVVEAAGAMSWRDVGERYWYMTVIIEAKSK